VTAFVAAVAVAALGPATGAVAAESGIAEAPSVVAAPAPAANAADFNPGFIVSDENFFNPGALTADQVQAFLNSQVPSCRSGYVCLKDYRQATPDLAPTLRCAAYPGSPSDRASDIIAKVGAVCGISQKALIVLLQKEQSLVTDTWPLDGQYRHATGYSCPDTAPCDPAYAGFFYQVYWAAYAFQAYRANNGGNYHPGVNTILWNPNAGCGASQVNIANLATAGLYTYTPYRPNQAALDNLYGEGDGCSSYGNRNFWRLWWDWFGSPTASPSTTIGSYDAAILTIREGDATIRFTGWSYDTAAPTAVMPVHVYLTDPSGVTTIQGFAANLSRPDVAAVHPAAGPNHGFDGTVTISKLGLYTACVYGIAGAGAAATFGCKYIRLGAEATLGNFEGLTTIDVPGTSMTLRATGWAVQQNLPDRTVTAHVYVTYPDGRTEIRGISADQPRPDVQAALSLSSPNHGFDFRLPLTVAGTYKVCVYAIGMGWLNQNVNPPLGGCRTLAIPTTGPVGAMAAKIVQTTTSARIEATGWALDPTWPALQTRVDVYSGPSGGSQSLVGLMASGASEASAGVPGAGSNHGFAFTRDLTSPGLYSVCAYGIGLAPFNVGKNPAVGCSTLDARSRAPLGAYDALQRVEGGLRISGWAVDRDVPTTPIAVHLYVTAPDSTTTVQGISASTSRPDVAAAIGGISAEHGFGATIPATQVGTYQVCAYAIGTAFFNRGINPQLGCRTVSTAPQAPIGAYDSLTRVDGGLRVSGWTLQRDLPTTSTQAHVYVTAPDGTTTVTGIMAADARGDIASAFPGAGAAHGYNVVIPASQSGTYQVCVYAIGAGSWNAGVNPQLGCKQISTAARAPIGSFDAALVVAGGLRLTGWTLQQDVPTASTQVRFEITAPDGSTSSADAAASASRGDIAMAFPGAGPAHGFDTVVPTSQSGAYRICATAIGAGTWNAGATAPLGCRSVQVSTG